MVDVFSPAERAALYRVIESRRDVRAFRTDPIAPDTLARILGAAHHAPSVGLMQPWNFIVIRDAATKARIKARFEVQNERALAKYAGARADLYRSLKLEGIEGSSQVQGREGTCEILGFHHEVYMPTDRKDLQARIAATKPRDTARGLCFNALFDTLEEHLGKDVAVAVDPERKGPRTEFFSYPVADFLRISFEGADRLERKLGSLDDAFRAFGYRTTTNVLGSMMGATMIALAGKNGLRALLGQAVTGYRATVSYGDRKLEWLGPRHARVAITDNNLGEVYLRAFVPGGDIGRVRIGQPARVYLDSAPNTPIDAQVIRIDPEASFTPENTYFREDRVKQVVGVKLLINGALGFAKPVEFRQTEKPLVVGNAENTPERPTTYKGWQRASRLLPHVAESSGHAESVRRDGVDAWLARQRERCRH